MWLILLWLLIIAQRLLELWIARKNGQHVKSVGGIEYGKEHYKYFVLLHSGFLVCLCVESTLRGRLTNTSIPPVSLVAFTGFIGTQLVRIWCIVSLGHFWNTRIIVLPGTEVIRKGPYRFIRHPNYAVVCCELILLSCIFDAYLTGIVFSILNVFLILHRVMVEEVALSSHTDYADTTIARRQLFPRKNR